MTFPKKLDLETQSSPHSATFPLLMAFYSRCASERLSHWLQTEDLSIEVRQTTLRLRYGHREEVLNFHPQRSLWSLSFRPESLIGFDRGLKILRQTWTLCRAEQEALSSGVKTLSVGNARLSDESVGIGE